MAARRKRMKKSFRFLAICALFFLPAVSFAAERFDGSWVTTLTCPAKGNTEGYNWKFLSVIQPGYLLIEGPIKDDGSAKLSANGIVASRKYARGVFAHEGEDYSYNIKAKFTETEGTGTRDQGMGIIGRPCTFEFVKQ
jgi:hypothetical protein